MEEKLKKLYIECVEELNKLGIDILNEKKYGKISISVSKRNNKRYGCCKQEDPDRAYKTVSKIGRRRTIRYEKYNKHKIEVGKNCFRCGLYYQGIMHDLSKYSWTEFSVGAKYFQGNRSPNEAEREEKGYTSSWLHHKGRNKHHLEYWIDYDLVKRDGSMVGMKMPDNYIVEMFCDRVAASRIYQGDAYTDRSALDYYYHGKSKVMLHPYTRQKLELLLKKLADEGEDAAFAYAK